MSDSRHQSETQTSPWEAARNVFINTRVFLYTRVLLLILSSVEIKDQKP
jgi:hypothetical protein